MKSGERMKGIHLSILGATGAVGREMLKILEERRFPIASLKLLASAHSVGKTLSYLGEDIPIEEASENAFSDCEIVLGAADASIARRFAPEIVRHGAVFIDNSSAFRHEQNVPLVVPEINPSDALHHHGIISNPNCSTIITMTAVAALHRLSPIQSIIASTYQAVSGAGTAGLAELQSQIRDYCAGKPLRSATFPHPIAFNLIAQIGSDSGNGYTSEEMKLQNEGRKILHAPHLKATCTCVRVPVFRSHSISATIFTERSCSVEEVRRAIENAPGCRLADDLENALYPTPLASGDQDEVLVGRIRKDLTHENGISLWCCADQLRKGAATNAVQIAELLL